MAGFAENPKVIESINIANKPEVISFFEEIFHNSLNHKLFLFGEAQRTKDSGGEISFIQLSMINRIVSGDTVYPELSRITNTNEWQLNWVIPILDSSDQQAQPILATIHFNTPANHLKQVLSSYELKLAKTEQLSAMSDEQSACEPSSVHANIPLQCDVKDKCTMYN